MRQLWKKYQQLIFTTGVLLLLVVSSVGMLSIAKNGLQDTEHLWTLGGWVWAVVGATVGIGFLSMATLQTIKQFAPLRAKSNRRELDNWLRQEGVTYGPGPEHLRRALLSLASTENSAEIENLPIELLTAQLSSASEMVLSFPERHGDLLLALAGSRNYGLARDYTVLMGAHRDELRSTDEEMGTSAGKKRAVLQQQLIDLRTQLSHAIQRRLDAFQVAAAASWRRQLQIWVMALSGLFAGAGALVFTKVTFTGFLALFLFYVPFAAVLGGFLASAWRDLFAILERLRR